MSHRPNRPWTQEEKTRAKEMRLSGMKIRDIAHKLDRSEGATAVKLESMYVLGRRSPWKTKDIERWVKQLYKPGILDTELQDAIEKATGRKCAKSTINRVRRRLGKQGVCRSEINRQNNYLRWCYHNAIKAVRRESHT